MARHAITLDSQGAFEKATVWLKAAYERGMVVEFRKRTRTTDQNKRMWELLGRVADRMDLMGRKWDAESWKCIFLKEMGREVKFLPSLNEQGFFPAGFRSSQLSTSEMADLQTFIEQWCAERGTDIWESDK